LIQTENAEDEKYPCDGNMFISYSLHNGTYIFAIHVLTETGNDRSFVEVSILEFSGLTDYISENEIQQS
jgi:hypothetical protein